MGCRTIVDKGIAAIVFAVAVHAQSTTIALPRVLKGVTYFPRGHAWYRMLYDWFLDDCESTTLPRAGCLRGQRVSDMADRDLDKLRSSGINFIHLYLWDQNSLQQSGLLRPDAGFVDWDHGGPQNSPRRQWEALNDFVGRAEARGILLHLEFAATWPLADLSTRKGSIVGANYAAWVSEFIDYLTITNHHRNIVIWGVNWPSAGPVSQDANDPLVQFWKTAYPSILATVERDAAPGPRPLLAVDADFNGNSFTDVLPRLEGYVWDWQQTQTVARNFRQQVGLAPDLFSFQLFNANSADLKRNLQCVAGIANSVCPVTPVEGGDAISPEKMVVTEFATSTSLEDPPAGNRMVSYGDAQTPTTSNTGQARWLENTLCVLGSVGISKFAYFGLYDSASLWESDYEASPSSVAWTGYWGLSSEVESYGDKPSWQTFVSYDPARPGGCGASPAPVVAMRSDAAYYTIGDIAQISYTAADAARLEFNQPVDSSYSCDAVNHHALLADAALVGSCAYTNALITDTTDTLTLTGTNPGASMATSQRVTVGLGPIVTETANYSTGQICDFDANPGCVLHASPSDTIGVTGAGFSPVGGNLIELRNAKGSAWLYGGDGLYFWNSSRSVMSGELFCDLDPGSWSLRVWNPHSNVPSLSVSLQIDGTPCADRSAAAAARLRASGDLSGTVIDDETGEPVAGASITLVSRSGSRSERPVIRQIQADEKGRYRANIEAGDWRVCIAESILYLDPCQSGGAGEGIIRLQKGKRIRISTRESGSFVARSGRNSIPMRRVYDSGRIRHYEALVPAHMKFTVSRVDFEY